MVRFNYFWAQGRSSKEDGPSSAIKYYRNIKDGGCELREPTRGKRSTWDRETWNGGSLVSGRWSLRGCLDFPEHSAYTSAPRSRGRRAGRASTLAIWFSLMCFRIHRQKVLTCSLDLLVQFRTSPTFRLTCRVLQGSLVWHFIFFLSTFLCYRN